LPGDHCLDQRSLTPGEDVGDAGVLFNGGLERPFRVFTAPFMQPLELVDGDRQRQTACLELQVDRLEGRRYDLRLRHLFPEPEREVQTGREPGERTWFHDQRTLQAPEDRFECLAPAATELFAYRQDQTL